MKREQSGCLLPLRTAPVPGRAAIAIALPVLLAGFLAAPPARSQGKEVSFRNPKGPAALNPRISGISILQQSGVRGRFSPDGKSVVFDRQDADGTYNVYITDLQGNITANLTQGNPHIPQGGNGNAIFDRSGKYIVFISEADNPYDAILGPGNPGNGILFNLWATDLTGSQFWQLTNIPLPSSATDTFQAYVNPIFSPDGSTLVWTNRYGPGGHNGWGDWRLLEAPYSTGGGAPQLGNQSVLFQPTTGNYITDMGFLDSTHLLTPGNLSGQNEYGMDEYILDTVHKTFVDLTNSPQWWEEGACISPNKEWIVYMDDITSPFALNFNNPDWPQQPNEREYWLMEANGLYHERLTYLNDPAAPEYLGNYGAGRVAVETCNFSPDGKSIVGSLGVDFGTASTAALSLKLITISFGTPSMFTSTGAPSIVAENAVVNAASYEHAFASQSWISIFGKNLAPDARLWRTQDFASNNLPASLDGVFVSVNGKPAFVSYISPTQLNVLAPDDTADGPVNIQVTTAGGVSNTVTATKQEFAPGWFMYPADGGKYIAAQHANFTPLGSTALYPGRSTPAKSGETIVLYGTGFGPTNPPLTAGQSVKTASPLSSKVTVEIGGVQATVKFAGRSASGVDQLNVVVPQLSNGDKAVVATVGGASTQANAYITVQN